MVFCLLNGFWEWKSGRKSLFADVGGLFGYVSFEFSFGKGFYNTPSVIIHGEMVAAIGH